MGFGPYAASIIGSYAIAGVAVAALVIWVLADYRRQMGILADLESRGFKRRAEMSPQETP